MLELSSEAVRIYPFDEWQAMKIEALMGLDRYKEAMDFYEETSRMFFEELGISPSVRTMKLFEEMSAKMTGSYQAAGEIEDRLKEEEEEKGAFYLSLPSFRGQLPVISADPGAEWTVSLSYGHYAGGRQGKTGGGNRETGRIFPEASRCDPEKPAQRRFFYPLQSLPVSDPSYRNK